MVKYEMLVFMPSTKLCLLQGRIKKAQSIIILSIAVSTVYRVLTFPKYYHGITMSA